MHKGIYLDNAATTALDPQVLDAMMPYMTEFYGNPSTTHLYGRHARLAIEQARKSVAKILNAKVSEIYFTSSGTESNNTAIHAAINDLGCKHIITSVIEHHAVLNTVAKHEQLRDVTVSYVQLLPDGHIDLEDLEGWLSTVKHKRCLVSLMHANNEIGNITDIGSVGQLCKKYNAIFHSDCVQTIGHYPIDLQRMNVHFVSASAHKFHGPKGSGLLYIKDGLSVKPFITGGGQERGMRSGTENVAAITGFARALEIATDGYDKENKEMGRLKWRLIAGIRLFFPEAVFNGDYKDKSLYTVLSVSLPKNEKTEMLLFNLDVNGFYASGGSACSSSHGSHVIPVVNKVKDIVTLRFSFSKYNEGDDIDHLLEKMIQLIRTEEVELK